MLRRVRRRLLRMRRRIADARGVARGQGGHVDPFALRLGGGEGGKRGRGGGRQGEQRPAIERDHAGSPQANGSSSAEYQLPWVPPRRRNGSFTVATAPASMSMASTINSSDFISA